jgi:hypothetical protein|tara:strand:+ start:72 stop:293 length:222 start_codon:yes stop_codon:yes gene_type:complete
MKKADANPQQNIVTDAINAHAEDILTDVRAILKLVRQNNLMEAVDMLMDLEKDLQQDYAVQNWQSSLRERNFR